ncbi:tripartite tricarboxylate transporter TctB family protein [Vreelandella boliviensis]|uniref:tripartite tricarboxylate transporter TctB family protein n=1 Tax=Vreelandella boliviensis TaxID=223527 RepID=UPI001B8CBB34|nr:tripartite tricarboxylate transporter TctB family protein [Halomonas boliviensis]MBS3669978.1 tripartite tricarboxylate transporter TctB family protein [Halomonas boliviensis]
MRFWFSLCLFVFSVVYFIYGLNTLNFLTSSGRPGPGYFPALVALGLILSTGINLVKDVLEIRQLKVSFFNPFALSSASDEPQELSPVVGGGGENQRHYPKDVVTVLLLVAALILVLTQLGGLLSMVLFMLVLLMVMNPGHWIKNSIYSVALPLFLYLLFDVWLNASLPIGVFGI